MIPYYAIPGLKQRDKLIKMIHPGKTLQQKLNGITDEVCYVLGVDKCELFNKCRKQEYVFARQIATYLIRKYHPEVTLKKIGEYFAGRDHTTAVHSIMHIKDLMETEEKTREIVRLIENRL